LPQYIKEPYGDFWKIKSDRSGILPEHPSSSFSEKKKIYSDLKTTVTPN
jgi:hypothetical protein